MGSFINLQIASLNCNGLIDSAKRKTLFEWFEKSRFQIFLLQETHFAPEQHLQIVREWKQGPIFLNSMGGGKCGTAILFNSFQFKILNEIYDKNSRVIVCDFDFFGNRIHLVNSYFPNESTEKLNFIQGVYKYLMSNLPIIWGGDFNLTKNDMIDR